MGYTNSPNGLGVLVKERTPLYTDYPYTMGFKPNSRATMAYLRMYGGWYVQKELSSSLITTYINVNTKLHALDLFDEPILPTGRNNLLLIRVIAQLV